MACCINLRLFSTTSEFCLHYQWVLSSYQWVLSWVLFWVIFGQSCILVSNEKYFEFWGAIEWNIVVPFASDFDSKFERKLNIFLNRVIWIIFFLLGFSLFLYTISVMFRWNKDMSCFRWWWQLIYQQSKLYSLANSQSYQLSLNCDIWTHMNSLILATSK